MLPGCWALLESCLTRGMSPKDAWSDRPVVDGAPAARRRARQRPRSMVLDRASASVGRLYRLRLALFLFEFLADALPL